jgi:hypothetical protein
MNILLTIIGIIGSIIVALLVIALFVKKEYSVKREIVINKPALDVFNYIKYLKNQDNFSKWNMMDPNMKKDYKGTDAQVGFVSLWEGNKKVGKGEQEITKVIDGKGLEMEIRFIKPFPGLAQAYMHATPTTDHQTTVSWGFNSSMKYPMNAMLLFMNMSNMIGKDFKVGLDNLKVILEK